ncbi:lipoprotein [Enterobacteriaceae bacterium RIT691]|nr:lipoprotein [Enterobacteriaceae bacterium RIT691]
MKKCVIIGAMLALSGCVQVDKYEDVVKAPAPAGLAGYWQSEGPQRAMVSPEAIATLIVTPEGDTLDCRQWQRVQGVPGKLMLRGEDVYNVTNKKEVYALDRDGTRLDYDRMTLKRVDRPTVECADYLTKHPLPTPLP